jgi:hypothetical protein
MCIPVCVYKTVLSKRAMQSGDDAGSAVLGLVAYVGAVVVVWMAFLNWLCPMRRLV